MFRCRPAFANALKYHAISTVPQIGRHLASVWTKQGLAGFEHFEFATCQFCEDEGNRMVDSMNRRELLRLSIRWPLTIKAENGQSNGETTNITGEGIFLYCAEKLFEGVVYSVTIKLPEKPLKVTGTVTWSNLDNCSSLSLSSSMGFYFIRIDEDKDRESLREAIVAQFKKTPHLQQETDRRTRSILSSEENTLDRLDGVAWNTQIPRH